MSDTGKINNSGALGPIKDSKTKPAASEAPVQVAETQRKDMTIKQNQVYSKPSETIRAQADQPSLAGHDLPELISAEQKPLVKVDKPITPKTPEKELKIDQQVLARNPVLAAQLKNRKPNSETGESKPKKSPPNPNPKTGFGKSKDIPSRFLRTQLPGRLKGISDERIDTLDKLRTALEARMPDQDPRLINAYAKTLLNTKSQANTKSVSIAELFAFDESVANLDANSLRNMLESLVENYELEPLQEQHIAEIISMLRGGDSEQLKALVRLFLPLPYPYTLYEPDEEFYEDERELREDSGEQDDEQEEDESKKEQKTALPSLTLPKSENSLVSISVRSLSYGKLHLLLDYNAERESVSVRIKSDRNFDELGLAIELALEDTGSCTYSSYHWRDAVFRLAETRDLQIAESGPVNPLILSTTNTLLQTIYMSDSDDGVVNADYKVL